jgi:sarcosine oxidase subunit beta
MGDDAPRWRATPEVDASVLPDRLARLVKRFPPAAGAPIERAWAGLYDMTPDAHPILDKVKENVFVACGFSGHGFMQAPAVGELMAEWILEGRRAPELEPFALDRFRGAPSFAETVIL